MPNWFNRKLTLPTVKHSTHDLSHNFKTSMNLGQLVPTNVVEMLPSDKILKNEQDVLVRLAPMYYALMHRIKIHTSNFFTPYRIIMGDELYEDWLNNKIDLVPLQINVYLGNQEHTIQTPNPFINSIYDYLGIPPSIAKVERGGTEDRWYMTISNPLPIFAYLAIIRDWYLDSNIEQSQIDLIDGKILGYRDCLEEQIQCVWQGNSTTSNAIFQVAYSKDYFNTARPQPELGSEMYVLNRPISVERTGLLPSTREYVALTSEGNLATVENLSKPLCENTTIKDLWKKEMLQHYYQIDNKFGTRIREKLAGHFGVEISDKRIMIPRYCGGSSSTVKIQEVIQTSSTTDSSALGFSAGRGVDYSRNRCHSYFCEEHGVFMSLISLIPENGYCNGMDRFWFKKNIYDFASPEFNNIGWQDVLNGEIFADGSVSDNYTFGYQPRYSEYRSQVSRVAGAFRNTEYLRWHLDRNFASLPPLNSSFLRVADTNRIFNYDGEETINTENAFVDVYNKFSVSRPISYEPDSIHIY